MYTLVFTDSELDTIFDALEELRISTDDDVEIDTIHSIHHKIYQACKVSEKSNSWPKWSSIRLTILPNLL